MWGQENLSLGRCCTHSKIIHFCRCLHWAFLTAAQGSSWFRGQDLLPYGCLPILLGIPKPHLPPDPWPLPLALWPTRVKEIWGGGLGIRLLALVINERASCFHFTSSLVRSRELQNWYFSKSWLLTRLCRQAVLNSCTYVRVLHRSPQSGFQCQLCHCLTLGLQPAPSSLRSLGFSSL
jgi:hypothetical protein